MSFDQEKAHRLEKLADARAQGLADAGVADLLDALNAHPDYVTTSSCAGRVQVLALPAPGDKAGSRVLGKWHRPATADEVRGALAKWDPSGGSTATLFGEPPILHALARTLPAAVALRAAADGAGFKRSTLRSVALDATGAVKKTVVEVAAAGRLEAPLARDGVAPDPRHLDLLARAAGDVVARGQARLPRLLRAVGKLPRFSDK